jgi:phospholipase/carboxylesterase
MEAAHVGLWPLGLDRDRDGLVWVPRNYDPSRPAPLLVLLHGAGGDAYNILSPFESLAEEEGVIVLAPDSRGASWDLMEGGFGPDVEFLDRALEKVFAGYAIDPQRLAIGGFSDGASYALSLGLINGDLFGHVLAFSPGFMAPSSQRGAPRLFICHGKDDLVLPIDRCSRKIVPLLRQAGYEVHYEEFADGHVVPARLARQGVHWFVRPPS